MNAIRVIIKERPYVFPGFCLSSLVEIAVCHGWVLEKGIVPEGTKCLSLDFLIEMLNGGRRSSSHRMDFVPGEWENIPDPVPRITRPRSRSRVRRESDSNSEEVAGERSVNTIGGIPSEEFGTVLFETVLDISDASQGIRNEPGITSQVIRPEPVVTVYEDGYLSSSGGRSSASQTRRALESTWSLGLGGRVELSRVMGTSGLSGQICRRLIRQTCYDVHGVYPICRRGVYYVERP